MQKITLLWDYLCFFIKFVERWFHLTKYILFYIFVLRMIYGILLFLLALIMIFLLWFLSYIVISSILPSKRAPTISSFDKDLNILKQLSLLKWKKILDLWCWNWKVLRFFEAEFDLIWEWYDINYFAIKWWKILNKIHHSKTKLVWKNFFEADLAKYDYIYVYLLPQQMAYVEDWIFGHIRQDTIIISNTFTFKKNQPFDIYKTDKWKGRIFLYKLS